MNAPIFISYSSQDQNIALTVCDALENRGLSCWISCRDISPDENFQVSIVRAIRAAKVMVLVFSANSNNSEEIKKELVLAGRSQLIVIPVRVEDVTPDEAFAYELATRQWIDLFADWESAIQRLARQLAALGDITVGNEAEISPHAKGGPDTTARAPSASGTASLQSRPDTATPARALSRLFRYYMSAAFVLLLGVAGVAFWYWLAPPSIQPTGSTPLAGQTASVPAAAKDPNPAPFLLADILSARFASVMPNLDLKLRQDWARAYESARGHKAQAVSLESPGERPGSWRSAGSTRRRQRRRRSA